MKFSEQLNEQGIYLVAKRQRGVAPTIFIEYVRLGVHLCWAISLTDTKIQIGDRSSNTSYNNEKKKIFKRKI